MKKNFEKEFWFIFDRVRGIDPQVVLFLVVFHKRGWLLDYLSSNSYSFLDYLHNSRFSSHKNQSDHFLENATNVFIKELDQLDRPFIHEIYQRFEEIDLELLDVFDSFLSMIYSVLGTKTFESMQPKELTQVMMSIADLREGDLIYNPFSGLNSFGINAPENTMVVSQELNTRVWGLGLLRALAYGKENDTKPLNSNSITEWQYSNYDCIISTPPFGLKLPNNNPEIGRHRQLESLLIDRALNNLKSNGRAVFTLSNNFLFNNSNLVARLREQLVEEGVLESVISLPGGIFKNTGIPSNILVIRKGYNKAPFFIDAKDLTKSVDKKRQKILDSDSVLEIYKNRRETKYSRFVSKEEIEEENFELSVGKFFIGNFEGIKLKEVLRPVKKERVAEGETHKLIKISDLSSSIDGEYTFSNDLADGSKNKRHLILRESALLVATTFDDLKPTLVHVDKEPVAFINLINAYKVVDHKADPTFLTHELRKAYIKEQVKALQVGSTIRRIRSKDLLNVKIQLPSLEQQREIVKNLEEVSRKLNEIKQERDAIALGQKIEKFREFGSIKHTTGTSRQSILDWSVNLIEFLKSNEDKVSDLNRDFQDLYNADMFEALESITNSIEYITRVLEKGEKGLILNNYPTRIVKLNELNKFIKKLQKPGFRFNLKARELDEADLKMRGIDANLDLLQIFFDNILSNANKHAFDSIDKLNNEVVVELTEADGYLRLEIKDNGKGFKKNYTKDKFIRRFSTTSEENGEGEGGFTIDQIAQYFGDKSWKLFLNEDELYRVKFLFKFKVKSSE